MKIKSCYTDDLSIITVTVVSILALVVLGYIAFILSTGAVQWTGYFLGIGG